MGTVCTDLAPEIDVNHISRILSNSYWSFSAASVFYPYRCMYISSERDKRRRFQKKKNINGSITHDIFHSNGNISNRDKP